MPSFIKAPGLARRRARTSCDTVFQSDLQKADLFLFFFFHFDPVNYPIPIFIKIWPSHFQCFVYFCVLCSKSGDYHKSCLWLRKDFYVLNFPYKKENFACSLVHFCISVNYSKCTYYLSNVDHISYQGTFYNFQLAQM